MLGTSELLIIFGCVVLLFGTSKLPELAKTFGSSVGEFKKARLKMEKEIKDIEEKQ